MKRKTKIILFFSVLATLMFTAVFAIPLEGQVRQTIRELIERQDIVDDDFAWRLAGELVDAGYNLDSPRYNQAEMREIALAMAENPDYSQEDWRYVAELLRIYSDGIDTEDGDVLGQVACTHKKKGVFWDSQPYDQCSKTCSSSGQCYSCCDAAKTAGDYDDTETRWCKRYCQEKWSEN
ncbi:MAG: hypothetical protein AABX08_02130 [Nanoarchaeota archaeon]